jgi:hypothetical protein
MESEPIQDYNARMYATFEALGTKPSEWKWDGQDPKENRGFGGAPAGACQLCGKHPIAYEYTIVNTAKGLRLIVGSECVANYVEAAPYGDKRKAKDEMQRLMMLNKMTNFLVEKNGLLTYETARERADEMTQYQIKAFFATVQRERNAKKLKVRAEALGKLMTENRGKLWDRTWDYFGQRTILSSLQYLKDAWARGEDKPYMEPAMNGALAKFGLELPAKPKLADVEEKVNQ